MPTNDLFVQYPDAQRVMETQLVQSLKQALPPTIELVSYNISRAGLSLYGLLHRKQNETSDWLTLRLTDHPLWLENAQQLFLDFGNPADLNNLTSKIQELLNNPKVNDYFYKISSLEKAILQFIDSCQKQNLIWAIRLPEDLFAAKKKIPLDLENEFITFDLYVGDRNNFNKLLLPVRSRGFQRELAILLGRNLLFSQFTRGRLLRLLPTNQWIQPLIEREQISSQDWKDIITKEYGQELIDVYEEGRKSKND